MYCSAEAIACCCDTVYCGAAGAEVGGAAGALLWTTAAGDWDDPELLLLPALLPLPLLPPTAEAIATMMTISANRPSTLRQPMRAALRFLGGLGPVGMKPPCGDPGGDP
jgi:hypothetical protein